MVRGIRVEDVDHIPRAVIAVGNQYPDGFVIPPHHHRRGQLISGAKSSGSATHSNYAGGAHAFSDPAILAAHGCSG